MPVRNRFDVAQAFASLLGGGLQGYRQGEFDQRREQQAQAREQREVAEYERKLFEAASKQRENDAKKQLALGEIQSLYNQEMEGIGRITGQSDADQAREQELTAALDREFQTLQGLAQNIDFDTVSDRSVFISASERALKQRVVARELEQMDMEFAHHMKMAEQGELQVPPQVIAELQQQYMIPGNGFGPEEARKKLQEYRQLQAESYAQQSGREETVQTMVQMRGGFGMRDEQKKLYDMYLTEYRLKGYTDISPERAKQDLLAIAAGDPSAGERFTRAFGWSPDPRDAEPVRAPQPADPRRVNELYMQPGMSDTGDDALREAVNPTGAGGQPGPAAPTNVRPAVQAILPLILQGIDPAEAAEEAGIPPESFTEVELAWLERMIR